MNDECGYLEGYFVDEVQGTNNYNDLNNIPTINKVEVKGDLTLNDLGIQPKGDYALEDDIPAPYDDSQIKEEINTLNEKVNSFEQYDDTEIREEIQNVNDKVDNLENYDDTQIKQEISDLNTKVDSLHNYDDTQVKQDIKNLQDDKADKTEIPNVSNFITNTVNNLLYYYTKTETYTQEEINQLISAIKTAHIEVVEARPEIGEENILYFVPKEGNDEDTYDEYVYVNGNWELIGTTQIDLSNYVTIELLNQELNNYVTSQSLTEILKDYALKNDIPTKVSQLQNDEGFIKGYTETDPTVPDWVKNITEEDIVNWNNAQSDSPIHNSNNLMVAHFDILDDGIIDSETAQFIIDNIPNKNMVLTIGETLFYIPKDENAIDKTNGFQILHFESKPIVSVDYYTTNINGTYATVKTESLDMFLEYGQFLEGSISRGSSVVSNRVSFLQTNGDLASSYKPTSQYQPANVKYVNDYVDEQVGNINAVLETLTTPINIASTFNLPKKSCKVTGTETYIEPINEEEVIEDGNN